MRKSKLSRTWVAVAALAAAPVVALAGDPAPQASQPDVAQLQEQIRQLQTQVQQLQSSQQQVSSQVVNQTVERVLRDADNRSRLLQADVNLTAGFKNDKFFIGSEDGNWTFMPGLLFQFRNTTNWDTGDDDDIDNGFEVRRAKVTAGGTAVTKKLSYYFQWNTATTGGGVVLDDAFVRYSQDDGIQYKVGQYKDPWYREETTSDAKQLAAERSMLNALLGGGQTARVQGVSIIHENEQYRGEVMYHDGANTINTNFQDGQGGNTVLGGAGPNYGVTVRFDWFFAGKSSKAVEDFTALGNKEDLFVVGAGVDYTEAGDNYAIFQTLDAQWENANGLAIYGALVGVYSDLGTGAAGGAPPAGEFYNFGGLLQAAYLVNDNCELFARYDITLFDEDFVADDANDTINELTIGTNYYYYKHNAKFVLDFTYLPDGSPTSQTGLGAVAGDDDQFIVRAQVQFYL
jgi:hypothetical protein